MFLNNDAWDGGGMHNINSHPTLVNCAFLGNSVAGGVSNNGGGMRNVTSNPLLINCMFSGNVSTGTFSAGGAMVNFVSNPTLVNCTFSRNSAIGGTVDGGAISNWSGSSPEIVNCVFWDNDENGSITGTSQIHVDSGAPVVNYSDVQGGWAGAGGIGNINADPLFVDPDGADDAIGTLDDNVRLTAGSLCIDAGDNSVVTESTDCDGNPRIVNGVVDMGAFEFQVP